MNKDPDVVPEESPLIILDGKSPVCMAKTVNNTKHTRHISRRMHFVRNGEEWNIQKTVWCEGGIQLVDIITNNVSEDGLNPRLKYTMVIIYNLHNTCTRGVIGYIRVWGARCSDDSNWLGWYGINSIVFKLSMTF